MEKGKKMKKNEKEKEKVQDLDDERDIIFHYYNGDYYYSEGDYIMDLLLFPQH